MPALRHASAFSIELRPDPGLMRLGGLAMAAAVAALLAALASHSEAAHPPWLPLWAWLALAAALLPPAALLGARLVARPVARALRWDGQAWWLGHAGMADERPIRAEVAMDLGGWLLLRLRPRGSAWARPRYLALGRAACPGQWTALRATLYAAPQRDGQS